MEAWKGKSMRAWMDGGGLSEGGGRGYIMWKKLRLYAEIPCGWVDRQGVDRQGVAHACGKKGSGHALNGCEWIDGSGLGSIGMEVEAPESGRGPTQTKGLEERKASLHTNNRTWRGVKRGI